MTLIGSVIDLPVHPDPPESSEIPSPSPRFDLAAEYDAHGRALFGFAVNALHDRGIAEDCVQETFLRAWRARDTFDPARASTRTWLFAIERNVIADVQRSWQRMPRTAPAESAEHAEADTVDALERLLIVEGLAKLSDHHRAAVVAIHLTGQSYAEMSTRTGVPVATLRSRVFYALRALRDHIEGKEDRRA